MISELYYRTYICIFVRLWRMLLLLPKWRYHLIPSTKIKSKMFDSTQIFHANPTKFNRTANQLPSFLFSPIFWGLEGIRGNWGTGWKSGIFVFLELISLTYELYYHLPLTTTTIPSATSTPSKFTLVEENERVLRVRPNYYTPKNWYQLSVRWFKTSKLAYSFVTKSTPKISPLPCPTPSSSDPSTIRINYIF